MKERIVFFIFSCVLGFLNFKVYYRLCEGLFEIATAETIFPKNDPFYIIFLPFLLMMVGFLILFLYGIGHLFCLCVFYTIFPEELKNIKEDTCNCKCDCKKCNDSGRT